MAYLDISRIGSACGKNKYDPRNNSILLMIARKNPIIVKDILIKNKNFKFINKEDSFKNELEEVYNLSKSNIKSYEDGIKVKDEIIERFKNNNTKKEDLNIIENILSSSVKKDCGNNNEDEIITKQNYRKGNNFFWKFNNDGIRLKGFHDATQDDVVIEIKTRMRIQNVRKNEYDLYQLFGYLLVMNKTKGKIVQKFKEVVFDSNEETDTEYGLIDISKEYWKDRFNKFIYELKVFFEDIDKVYNIEELVEITVGNKIIASIDENDFIEVLNPNFEGLIKCFR